MGLRSEVFFYLIKREGGSFRRTTTLETRGTNSPIAEPNWYSSLQPKSRIFLNSARIIPGRGLKDVPGVWVASSGGMGLSYAISTVFLKDFTWSDIAALYAVVCWGSVPIVTSAASNALSTPSVQISPIGWDAGVGRPSSPAPGKVTGWGF